MRGDQKPGEVRNEPGGVSLIGDVPFLCVRCLEPVAEGDLCPDCGTCRGCCDCRPGSGEFLKTGTNGGSAAGRVELRRRKDVRRGIHSPAVPVVGSNPAVPFLYEPCEGFYDAEAGTCPHCRTDVPALCLECASCLVCCSCVGREVVDPFETLLSGVI